MLANLGTVLAAADTAMDPSLLAARVSGPALIMRTDAPILGGELTAVIDPVTSDGESLPTSPQTVGCFVVSADERLLDQTVIALDDRPVPFAA